MCRGTWCCEMAQTIYCRHADCGKATDVIAGQFADICPSCQRPAFWASEPGRFLKERRKAPRVPFVLNFMDKRLLRQLRIGTE